MDNLEKNILLLKSLASKYETNYFLQFISFAFLTIGERENSPFVKNLLSPQRQLFYLAYLHLQSEPSNNIDSVAQEDWDKMTNLLHQIEVEYFDKIAFHRSGNNEIEFDKIKLVLPTFMNYFSNGSLAYEEQEIERIENVFLPFHSIIESELGFSVNHIFHFYETCANLINLQFNDSVKFFNHQVWEEFTSKCIEKGILDPREWVNEAPEDFNKFFKLMYNPGAANLINLKDVDYSKIDKYIFKRIINFLSCSRQPNNEILYYTSENLLLRKPFYKINENEYVPVLLKQSLFGVYQSLFDFCKIKNQDKILKQRGVHLEDKVFEVLNEFFKGEAFIYRNYYANGHHEQDLLLLYKNIALVVEIKSTSYREPSRNPITAFEKLKFDFKKNIQSGYDQSYRIKRKFIQNEKFSITQSPKGKVLFEVSPNKYSKVFTIIITLERLGAIQTDLSGLLNVNDDDDYPWSVCIDDLEVFLLALKRKTGFIQNLISFLDYRHLFHGHVFCADELELCSLFLTNRKKFIDLSKDEATDTYTQADLTNHFEILYEKGLGFKRERFFKEKREGKIGFFLGKSNKRINSNEEFKLKDY